MVIPLGVIYTDELLGAGKSGFGVLLTALGFGVGAGVLLVFFFRNTIDKAKIFTRVLFGAGISLFATVSTGQIHFAMVMLFVGGICLGGVAVSSVIGTLYICVAFVVVRSTAFNKNVSAKIEAPC